MATPLKRSRKGLLERREVNRRKTEQPQTEESVAVPHVYQLAYFRYIWLKNREKKKTIELRWV